MLLDIEVGRDPEVALASRREPDVSAHARHLEGADPLAVEIVADDIPVALVEAKPVGIEGALACARPLRAPVAELHRPLLGDGGLELREPARELRRVVRCAHAYPLGRLGGRLREAGAAERQVLQGEPERLGVRELPLEVVERGLQRRELVVVELEALEEVVLRAQGVELLARELVALRLERDAEGRELGAVGVEPARECLVRHLAVPLDVRLDVTGGEKAALGHEKGHERELADQLVGVVRHRCELTARAEALRGDGRGLLEVLVRRAVVAAGERRSLARLALARRRVAAGDAAVEEPGLDLLLDEGRCRADAFANRPRDLCLRGDREVPADVGEERAVGAGKVVRVLGEPRHRPLALDEHGAAVLELILAGGVWIDEILDGAIDHSRVLIHTGAKLGCVVFHRTYSISPDSLLLGEKGAKLVLRTGSVAPF